MPNTGTSASTAIACALIGLVGVVVGNTFAPVFDYITGRKVPAEQLEAAKRNADDAEQKRQVSADALVAEKKKLAAVQSELAVVRKALDAVNRMVAENQRGPQVVKLAVGSEYRLPGSDLEFTVDMIAGSAGTNSATIRYRDKKYEVSAGPNGGASIVTAAHRNCTVQSTSITNRNAILVVECEATEPQ